MVVKTDEEVEIFKKVLNREKKRGLTMGEALTIVELELKEFRVKKIIKEMEAR